MVPLLFDDREMFALREGALFWPAHHALLVADLHLEKASWFGAKGQHLPPYDSMETLSRIERLIAQTNARAVWCLGDSFHDADGEERLPREARHRLASLAAATDWLWITGNHDVDGARSVGRVLPEAEVDGLLLRHEAVAGETRPEISGHFHPKFTLRHRGQNVSRRCFVTTGRKLVLPAFGALTGGLDATHPALRAAIGAGGQALVPAAGRLLQFALG